MKKMICLILASTLLLSACSTQEMVDSAKDQQEETMENQVTNVDTTTEEKTLEDKTKAHYTFNDEDIAFDLTYKTSEEEANEDIEKAVNEYFFDGEAEDYPYAYQYHDLNDDGIEEAIVLLSGINFAGSGGATMVIMKKENDTWTIFSKNTLVNAPVIVANAMTNGYHDIILYVSGGGQQGNYHLLKYDGISYPLNPSTQDLYKETKLSGTALLADETLAFIDSKK